MSEASSRISLNTLEALREDACTIMTILDVLRYSPLYSWSLRPLRLRKVQGEAQDEWKAVGAGGAKIEGEEGKKENEQGLADRALTVVKKKLNKSLSVKTTVNELVQQARYECEEFGGLFYGWAALCLGEGGFGRLKRIKQSPSSI